MFYPVDGLEMGEERFELIRGEHTHGLVGGTVGPSLCLCPCSLPVLADEHPAQCLDLVLSALEHPRPDLDLGFVGVDPDRGGGHQRKSDSTGGGRPLVGQ